MLAFVNRAGRIEESLSLAAIGFSVAAAELAVHLAEGHWVLGFAI